LLRKQVASALGDAIALPVTLDEPVLDESGHLLEEMMVETAAEVGARHTERRRKIREALLRRRPKRPQRLEIRVIVRQRDGTTLTTRP
jgi:hypothetical protein